MNPLTAAMITLLLAAPVKAQTILHVDDDAAPGGDGLSWTSPMRILQDALASAAATVSAFGVNVEIRVAGGLYKPDQGAAVATGDRAATFRMLDQVSLLGGYAGLADPVNPDSRSITLNESTLSGEIGSLTTTADNTYNIITARNIGPTAMIDGFTVTGGLANGPGLGIVGAGMLIHTADVFVGHCLFTGNATPVNGGGMYSAFSAPVIVGCVFVNNSADRGGGLYNADRSDPNITNCVFLGNTAGQDGGGMFINRCATPALVNCLFSGNSSGVRGGAIFDYSNFTPAYRDCTIAGNTSANAGGVFITTSNGHGVTTIANSILWGNTDASGSASELAQIVLANGGVVLNRSCVQGLTGAFGGVGNISADPLFLNAAGPDGVLGTLDDNLRVSPTSQAIDAGDNTLVPPDALDLDGDGDTTEPVPLDLDLGPRFLDAPAQPDTGVGDGVRPVVDIGAYEFSPGATPCPADLDGDGSVGGADIAILLGFWMSTNATADLNQDGVVNVVDLATLIGSWGPCP